MTAATDRVVAEAALARRLESQVSEKANKSTVAELRAQVNLMNEPLYSTDSRIGIDTDGTPYLKI